MKEKSKAVIRHLSKELKKHPRAMMRWLKRKGAGIDLGRFGGKSHKS